ncbi:hypothetical protein [Brevibacterium aurantiacum]|uniref:Abortive infection protein-like C-terminal domain-containing protein n=1 Tax=Brevibacterium aurantiacum TaxID=273384 RepID=A0A556C5A8_BREAU|nr:hypothetical protein [Brevibacterium aurantiacum]TSI12645.1 hypothetical protein FO013_19415 [Brevibacterium aurantiacum]
MNEDEKWRPVVPTGREDILNEEFPSYLREAVFPWLAKQAKVNGGWVYADFFVEFQNSYRDSIGFQSGGYHDWRNTILPHIRTLDDEDFTNIIDFALSRSRYRSSNEELENSLSNGGSAWTIMPWGTNANRLARRVAPGVMNSVRPALSAQDSASIKLQEAWHDAYGVAPRASTAFFHAVVAVEIAALSVIDAGTDEPTMANLFSILESPKPKWQLVFRDNEKAPGGKTLAAMLRTLWRGHGSRHGSADYKDATLNEARAAVILAATLVQWFTSGVIVKVDAEHN